MDITVILPVFNERHSIGPLLIEIEKALTAGLYEYEVIAVDDGSADGTGTFLQELAAEKPYLRVLVLRKNYGQSAAFDAGFRHASGRVIVTMDADGQNDPADVPRPWVGSLKMRGCDFVCGRRAERQDGLILRAFHRGSQISLFAASPAHVCTIWVARSRHTAANSPTAAPLRRNASFHRRADGRLEGKDTGNARQSSQTLRRAQQIRNYADFQSRAGFIHSLVYARLSDKAYLRFWRNGTRARIYRRSPLEIVVLIQKFVFGVWVHLNPLFIISMIFSVMAVQFLVLGLLAEIMVRTYFESQHKPTYLIGGKIGFDVRDPLRPIVTHLLGREQLPVAVS